MTINRIDVEVLRNNLRGYRVRAGLKQRDVATAMDICVPTMVRWEQRPDKLPFDTLVKLADLYKVSIDDFFKAV